MQEYNLYFVVIILLYKYGYYNPLICAKIRNKHQTMTKLRKAGRASASRFRLKASAFRHDTPAKPRLEWGQSPI
jgi:hypothetical protein